MCVINGSKDDKMDLNVDNVFIGSFGKYVYLGSIFTSQGSVSADITAYTKRKMCHILKFVSFIKKNSDAPF